MKEILIEGMHNIAKCFCVDSDKYDIDQYARAQIKAICNNKAYSDCKIRIMPDVHAGKVGPIGLSIIYNRFPERIIPNMIGSDIGCGVLLYKVKPKKRITKGLLQELDSYIRNIIPYGSNRQKDIGSLRFGFNLECAVERLHKKGIINFELGLSYVGTLGGGNHFIEIDKDEDDFYYICIHTGSRYLGQCVNKYYNDKGQKYLKDNGIFSIPYEYTYLENHNLKCDYLESTRDCEIFAKYNRETIANKICSFINAEIIDVIDNFHNYYESYSKDHNEKFVIRKGCIASEFIEKVVIPINARDGIIIGNGKHNEDWNCSAPHGAGRIIKRSEVKNTYNTSMYKKEMKGIYSTSISKNTLDEAPFAYRDIELIRKAIEPSVNIINVLKPVYNFKAGGKE